MEIPKSTGDVDLKTLGKESLLVLQGVLAQEARRIEERLFSIYSDIDRVDEALEKVVEQ